MQSLPAYLVPPRRGLQNPQQSTRNPAATIASSCQRTYSVRVMKRASPHEVHAQCERQQ